MRFISILASGLFVFAAACGGGSDGGTSGNTADPEAFAKHYLLTNANAFSGEKSAKDMVALYTPKCREGTNEKDLESAIKMAQGFVPKVKGVKFEDVDFNGKLVSTKTSNGFDVTMPPSKDMRLKINGKWGNMHEQLVTIGLEEPSEGTDTDKISFELVNGKLLAADCDAISLN